MLDAVCELRFTRPSRGDLLANLLLYAPLGLCLTSAWPRRWRPVVVFGMTVVCGTGLSVTVEVLQQFAPERVASLTDVAVNAMGTMLGAVAGLLYGVMDGRPLVPGMAPGRVAPVPLGVIALWLAYRLAPFVPTIDWQKYKAALKPLLLHPQLTGLEVFHYLIGWLVVSGAVQQIWPREYTSRAVAGIAILVLLGCLFIVGKDCSVNEIVALALVIPVGGVLRLLPERVHRVAIALSLAAVLMVQGLQPWHFLAYPHTFSWIPFHSSMSGSIEVNYVVFLEKCFWYTALMWLLTCVGIGMRVATVTAALLLLMIEVGQMWLPDHSAEITDPLLALLAGNLIAHLGPGVVRESKRLEGDARSREGNRYDAFVPSGRYR
jgi:VanZ family protein